MEVDNNTSASYTSKTIRNQQCLTKRATSMVVAIVPPMAAIRRRWRCMTPFYTIVVSRPPALESWNRTPAKLTATDTHTIAGSTTIHTTTMAIHTVFVGPVAGHLPNALAATDDRRTEREETRRRFVSAPKKLVNSAAHTE